MRTKLEGRIRRIRKKSNCSDFYISTLTASKRTNDLDLCNIKISEKRQTTVLRIVWVLIIANCIQTFNLPLPFLASFFGKFFGAVLQQKKKNIVIS